MFCLKNLLDLLIKLQNNLMGNMSPEERKTQLEIKKLEGETGLFKRTVEFISTLSSLITAIIAVGTLVYAIQSDLIKNLVTKLKNDNSALQVKVDRLNNEIKILGKEKMAIESKIQKSRAEFIVLEEKYRKEKIKLSQDIITQKKQVKSINDKLTFTEDCYSEAQKFIVRFCVYYVPYNDHDYHPNVLVFDKTNEEIANLNILKMNYVEFLINYANFKKINRGYQEFLVSDKIREVHIDGFKRTDTNQTGNYINQFECWKGLTKDQKIKMLTKVTNTHLN